MSMMSIERSTLNRQSIDILHEERNERKEQKTKSIVQYKNRISRRWKGNPNELLFSKKKSGMKITIIINFSMNSKNECSCHRNTWSFDDSCET